MQIAEQTEKLDSIGRKIKGAMTYPIVLIGGMIAVVVVLMVKVIPTLLEFFGDPETLPETTKMVLAISNFLTASWMYLVIFLIAGIILIKFWSKTPN